MPRPAATLLLVVCTMLWGFAFIAQKTAMDSMGPLTFTGMRYLLGGLVILPLAIWEYRRKTAAGTHLTPRKWREIAAVTAVFFMGSWLQQAGLLTTTVTNGGFLTGLYVFFVPVILLVFWRIRPHPMVWICVPLALAGLYYLNGGGIDHLNSGDGLVIGSAVFWAMHVLLLGYLARTTGMPVFISAVTFLGAGLLATTLAFPLESPTLQGISGGWIEIAYAGILSTAVSFTLQAVGQQYVPPANAAIILSGESLFAALGGAIILGERLPPIGYFGAALIFLAIVLVETVPIMLARRRPQAAA
jgi:drug/metabolite transporter (DMT)-like permease